MARKRSGGVVWSSDGEPRCETCGEPRTRCTCAAPPSRRAGDGVVWVGRETKGRKGAGVTVVTGVPLEGAALRSLAKELKTLCGSGGTIKDGRLEIQGDHRDRLVEALTARGWTVRRSGG